MTVRDLAKIAEVSPATISAVINNKPSVSEKKRNEILNLMKQYDYKVKKKKTKIKKNLLFLKLLKSGILIEQNAGFITRIMDSIQTECNEQGYKLLIHLETQNYKNAISNLDLTNIGGIFVVGSELTEDDFEAIESISIPYIVIDHSMPFIHCNSITMSNIEMTMQAIEYLSRSKETKFGYLKSSVNCQNFIERSLGVDIAIKKYNLDYNKSREFLLEPTIMGSYNGLKEYIKKGCDLPKIIFADNDIIALGAMKALKEEGIRIPEDVSLIGFDDIYMAESSTPSLSTIHVQRTMIGKMATITLINEINKTSPTYYKTTVGGKLIIRESTKNI